MPLATLLKALVFAALALIHPQAPKYADKSVVDAIAVACADEASPRTCALTATVWAWHESNFQRHPRPYSWDAKAGRAVGPFQLLASVADGMTVLQQAREWLREVRVAGLVSVCGGGSAGEKITETRLAEVNLLARKLL